MSRCRAILDFRLHLGVYQRQPETLIIVFRLPVYANLFYSAERLYVPINRPLAKIFPFKLNPSVAPLASAGKSSVFG